MFVWGIMIDKEDPFGQKPPVRQIDLGEPERVRIHVASWFSAYKIRVPWLDFTHRESKS